MCLAVPLRLIQVDGNKALAEAMGVLFAAFAPQILSLFGAGAAAVAFGAMQARIEGWFYFLIAMSHSSAGVLRGAGLSIVPMFIITGSWCVLRVLYLLFIARPAGSLALVLWGYPLTWLVSFVLFIVVFAKVDWLHHLDRKAAETA